MISKPSIKSNKMRGFSKGSKARTDLLYFTVTEIIWACDLNYEVAALPRWSQTKLISVRVQTRHTDLVCVGGCYGTWQLLLHHHLGLGKGRVWQQTQGSDVEQRANIGCRWRHLQWGRPLHTQLEDFERFLPVCTLWTGGASCHIS